MITQQQGEVSRRQFLKLSGGIGGGLMLALYLRPVSAQSTGTSDPTPAFVTNAFIRIEPDDSILIYAKSHLPAVCVSAVHRTRDTLSFSSSDLTPTIDSSPIPPYAPALSYGFPTPCPAASHAAVRSTAG